MDSRDIINSYFGNVVFYKALQTTEAFAMYVANFGSTGNGIRSMAIAMVPIHLAIDTTTYLSNLHWRSIQTRSRKEGIPTVSPHGKKHQVWKVPRDVPSLMFVCYDKHNLKYVCENFPELEMMIIRDNKKAEPAHYNLIAALNTYRCVLQIKDIPIHNDMAMAMDNSFEIIKN